ncbi:hypothetical protein K2Y11_08895 [bacterium]|nr:hypothetical protein [bacterium]
MNSNPDIPILPVEDRLSILPYVNRKHLELSNKYSRSKKIYLDTKYWLILRDHRLGRAKIPEAAKLHDTLVHGLLENRFVCPISATTWLEILSQTDPTTLRESAKLIDNLSLGLSIIEERQRISIKIKHFLYHGLFKIEHLHPLESLVWTKVGYILGFTTPVNEKLSRELDITLQKDSLTLCGRRRSLIF